MAGVPNSLVTSAEAESMYIYNLCYAAEVLQNEGMMGLIEPLCAQVMNVSSLKHMFDLILDENIGAIRRFNLNIMMITLFKQEFFLT